MELRAKVSTFSQGSGAETYRCVQHGWGGFSRRIPYLDVDRRQSAEHGEALRVLLGQDGSVDWADRQSARCLAREDVTGLVGLYAHWVQGTDVVEREDDIPTQGGEGKRASSTCALIFLKTTGRSTSASSVCMDAYRSRFGMSLHKGACPARIGALRTSSA